MVALYFTQTQDLPDPALTPEVLGAVSEKRREFILRLRAPLKRKERFGAELLLDAVLPVYGRRAEDVFYDENGKPCLPGFYFSYSHSGGNVLLACSSRPVGCDLEKLRMPPYRVAARYFTVRERKTLCGGAVEENFFRLWTGKESYLKMTGEGLKGLPRIEIDCKEGAVFRDGKREDCLLRQYTAEEYVCSVCAWEEAAFPPVTVCVEPRTG